MQTPPLPSSACVAWLVEALEHWTQRKGWRAVKSIALSDGPDLSPPFGREDAPCAFAVLDGSLRLHTPKQTVRLIVGDVAVLAAFTAHRWDAPVPVEFLMLICRPEGVSVQKIRQNGRHVQVLQSASGTLPQTKVLGCVLGMLAEPDLEASMGLAGWDLITEILLCSQFEERRKSGGNPLACQARELIERDFANPNFDITVLAQHLGVHRTTLLRAFRRQNLGTPEDLLLRRRIEHAQYLLRTTTDCAQTVAQRCGFHSRQTFLGAFRRRIGRSPSKYRRLGHHDGQRLEPG